MPITIVSIEDEQEISELLSIVLDSPDLNILAAHNAADGMALIRSKNPDLVIADIMLPDTDGWSIYDEMRNDQVLCNIPIVLLTALRREFQPRRMFRPSAKDAYLTKPFDMTQLRHQIETMLGQRIW